MHKSVVDFVVEVVFLDDVVWHAFDGYFHMFACRKWSVETEVFNVDTHELGMRCGNDGVGKHFEGEQVCCLGAGVSETHNAVTSNGPSHAFWVGLGRTICCDNFEVRWLFPFWQLMAMDEPHGVGALDVALFVSLS